MKDMRLGKELVGQFRHPLPHQSSLLAAPAEYPVPKTDDAVTEGADRRAVCRHRVIGLESGDDLRKPLARFGDWPVHTPAQLLLDLPQLCPHAVTSGFPPKEKFAVARGSADEHEAQEREGLRLGEPALLAVLRRKAAELLRGNNE